MCIITGFPQFPRSFVLGRGLILESAARAVKRSERSKAQREHKKVGSGSSQRLVLLWALPENWSRLEPGEHVFESPEKA